MCRDLLLFISRISKHWAALSTTKRSSGSSQKSERNAFLKYIPISRRRRMKANSDLVDLCYSGTAEVFRFGCPGAPSASKSDLDAAIRARVLFEKFTDKQMAIA